MKLYTSGGIQKRKDGGRRWRLALEKFVTRNKLDLELVHPPDILNPNFNSEEDARLLYDNEESWYKKHEATELEDLRLVRHCDATVFYYDGKQGVGTDLEFIEAYNNSKLMYFIRMIPKPKIPHWIMWRLMRLKHEESKRVTIFTSLTEFKLYLKSHLKRVEEKK